MAFEEKCVNQALKMAQIKAFKMVGEEGFEPSRGESTRFVMVRNYLLHGNLMQREIKS